MTQPRSRRHQPARFSLPPRTAISTAIGLAFASASPVLWAQTESERPGSAVELPTVEVEAQKPKQPNPYKPERASSPKYTQPLLDTPQSVTVLPEEIIEAQAATTLRDVLRNVPGISIQAGEGNPPSGDQLKLRGFSVRDDLYVDGVRDVGFFTRDPFNVEAVEVAKGPASAITGRGSTGGSVNLVSKSPRLNPFGDLSLTLGTDDTRRITADWNQPLTDLAAGAAVRLNVMAHESEVERRDEVFFDRWGLAPSIAFGLGSPTRLTLSLFHMEQDNLPDFGIPTVRDAAFANNPEAGRIAPVDLSNFYGYTERDYEDVESTLATVKFEHDFSDRVGIRNQLRYGRTHNDSIISAPRICTNAAGACAGNVANNNQFDANTLVRGNGKPRDQVEDILINQLDATVKLNALGVAHTLVGGLEIARQDAENERRLDVDGYAGPLFNFDPNLPQAEPAYNGTRAQLESDTVALYVFDTIELDKYWQLSGGIRHDRIKTTVRGIDDSGAFPGFVTDLDRTDSDTSWRLAAVYKPQDNASVYAGIGTSFEPVASSAVTSGVVQLAGGNNNPPATAASFDVKPEKTRTLEVGTKWELYDKRLLVNAAIFRIEKTDARNIDPVNPAVVTVDGEQKVDGFEIGLTGKIDDRWSVLGAYTYLDSEIAKSNLALVREGEEIDNTPKHSLSLWNNYQFTPRLQAGVGLQYVDERTNLAPIPVTVDDYWRVDLMASYALTQQVDLRLNILNAADEEYIDQLGSGQAVPGAGRTMLVTTSYKF